MLRAISGVKVQGRLSGGNAVREKPSGLDAVVLEDISEKEVTLSALVSDLSKRLGYDADRVIIGLMDLQSRKKIAINEKKPYASFASYILSPLSLSFWGSLAVTLLSVALIFVTSGLALYLRYVFGGLLILFTPGYSLIELLYPKKELDDLTKVALSIGLSLALVPLVGLMLNYTPFGIRLFPVAFSLAGLTVILQLLALRRKHTHYKVGKDLA